MGTVKSRDGTTIAFDEYGPADAPAVVHVYAARSVETLSNEEV